jgi:hypothetical protein
MIMGVQKAAELGTLAAIDASMFGANDQSIGPARNEVRQVGHRASRTQSH